MDALENEIRSSYRLLAKAWQPENFQDDPKSKDAVDAKLKDINTAFEFLTLTSTDRAHAQRPVYLSSNMGAVLTLPNAISDAQAALGSNAAPAPSTTSTTPSAPVAIPTAATPQGGWQEFKARYQKVMSIWKKIYSVYRKVRLLATIAAVLFVLITGGSLWTALRPGHSAIGQTPSERRRVFLEELAQELKKLDPRSSTPEADAPAQFASHAGIKSQNQRAASHQVPSETIKLKPYITVGSTRDEVLALRGTPTSSTPDKLVYGNSELYLKDNAVAGWRIDPVTSPIRVKLWPQSPVDPDTKYFSVDSSKDEVLIAQGTPTEFSVDTFKYGNSIVYFRNNKVMSWKQDPASIQLHIR
jgi:hypothetical protein